VEVVAYSLSVIFVKSLLEVSKFAKKGTRTIRFYSSSFCQEISLHTVA